MNFESLANELILDIYEYFTVAPLLRAFRGLNTRFDRLLYLHFQTYSLDFRSISKQDFDFICEKNLSLITDRITSIHLSNDDDTPEEPYLFFSYGFRFQQFTNLQSLSLYYIRSTDLISQIILDCPYLIYLNISKCNFDDDMNKAKVCVNYIWNLSKLKCCYLDLSFLNEFIIPLPTTISLSLRYLSIENDPFSLNGFISLIKCTPNLRKLNIRIQDTTDSEQIPFVIPLLTKLKVYFKGSLDTLRNLLKNLPNLFELIIQTDGVHIDGYQWEEMIMNYLKKLKVFRLLMFFRIDDEKNLEEEIDQLIESFQSIFWLNEHQWFIRCDCDTESRSTYLHTLPYGFKKFHNRGDISKSTYPTDKKDSLYNHVNTLKFDHLLSTLTSQFPIQFSNIHHLELSFPFDNIFWETIKEFDRLTSLEIISGVHLEENDPPIADLCMLLDRSIHLYSLTIDYLVMSQLSTVQITSQSICRLDLIANDGHFYGSECVSLIQSLLYDRCEILLINLENRTIVLDLIEKLINLRALTFQCQDDRWGDSNESLLIEDELVQWLKHRLPSNCSIIRDESEISAVRLWIR